MTSSIESSPRHGTTTEEEENGDVVEENKFQKDQQIQKSLDDPFCTVHYEAQAAFLQGQVTAAQQRLSFNRRELTDDDYHHQLFLEKGHNHRMIYRNNLAILKEATLSGGSAEVLFRVSLDDAFKYSRDPLLAQSLPHSIMEKLEKEVDMVRYNLALSWLMNPNHSQAAFSALIYGIKKFPSDVRLWLHAAEACISYLCSTRTLNKKQDFLVPPLLPSNSDVCYRPMSHSENRTEELDMMRAYFPDLGEQDSSVQPTFEFAEVCLMNAKKLAMPESRLSVDLLTEPTETIRNGPIEESLYITILLAASFVALRLHKYQSALDDVNKVLASKNVTLAQMVLAKCYRDLCMFLLGDADWTIFTPIELNEEDHAKASTDISEDNARKVWASINAARKYHHTLGYVMDPINSNAAVECRLEEYLKESEGRLARTAKTMLISLLHKNSPSETPTMIKTKIQNLHCLLMRLSPMYRDEYCKREGMKSRYSESSSSVAPPKGTQQIMWALMNEVRNSVPSANVSLRAMPEVKKELNNPVFIKLSHKGGKSIRIPW